jgi:KDO2-lipid IV(A) lauroyltransferase
MAKRFRHVRHLLQALLVFPLYGFFWLIGIRAASFLAGRIAQRLGPLLKVHRTAKKNLERALPELSGTEREAILRAMWDNLGRVAGEAPHIPRLHGKRFARHVEIIGTQHLRDAEALRKGGIFFSGHFANWELAPKTAYELGQPLVLMYRPANNPWAERLYQATRRRSHAGMFAKGTEGARAAVKTLKQGRWLGMLVDQKMNEGIPVPFFGHPAMTAPAVAEFALRYDCPLLPARVVRLKGPYFKVIISPPMETKGKDVPALLAEIHTLFEGWIREHPAQWMWVHNRWPKENS